MAIHVDFETYSEADLPTVGAPRYAEDASTEALIVSYALEDNGPVTVVDLTRDSDRERKKLLPLFRAVEAGETVSAHNSQFERVIWAGPCREKLGWPVEPKPGQWDCTAARAAAIAIPRSLEGAATALKLGVAKDPLGKQLIQKFSKPQPRNKGRIFSTDDPEAFRKFMEYCEQDTVVEMQLDRILPRLTPFEEKIFELDYKINQEGIPLDVGAINRAIEYIEETSEKLIEKAKALTGVKPTQRDRLLEWLQDNGTSMDTLQAAEVEQVIAKKSTPRNIKRLLETRIEVTRAGTKKLKTMLACASSDGRVRGGFWYHSATTGRWGSGGVQFHNLSKPDDDYPQDEVLWLLDRGALDLFYDRPLTALSKCIRGFIHAEPGKEFVVADYSSVEARGLAWLADEPFILEAYRAGLDVYKTMATKIYGTSYDNVDEHQRFFGKQTILGAGYGMGPPKFVGTCERFGVSISLGDSKRIIRTYRDSVPRITKFWKTIERAAFRTVLTGRATKFAGGKLRFSMDTLDGGFEVLFLQLPSGRRIAYPEPRIEQREKFGKTLPCLIFKTYYRGMWVDEETYGGKLTENAVQALCRDLLAEGMVSVDEAGFPIVIHVHDEIGSEVPTGACTVKEYEALACKVHPWAKDLPLEAKGKLLQRYDK